MRKKRKERGGGRNLALFFFEVWQRVSGFFFLSSQMGVIFPPLVSIKEGSWDIAL